MIETRVAGAEKVWEGHSGEPGGHMRKFSFPEANRLRRYMHM